MPGFTVVPSKRFEDDFRRIPARRRPQEGGLSVSDSWGAKWAFAIAPVATGTCGDVAGRRRRWQPKGLS